MTRRISRRTCVQQMPCSDWASRRKRCVPIKKGSASAPATHLRRFFSPYTSYLKFPSPFQHAKAPFAGIGQLLLTPQ